MNLREYIQSLQKFMENNENSSVMTAITADDEEGNSYTQIVYPPSIGQYKNTEFEAFDPEEDSEKDINAVLVN